MQQQIIGQRQCVIFDIGANHGGVTQIYNSLFPGSKIIAFEPFPGHVAIFKSRFSNSDNILLNNIALTDTTGTSSFNVNNRSETNSLLKSAKIGASSDAQCVTIESIQVSVDTLDNFCDQNNIKSIDILKMDVQGSELNILKGAPRLLNKGSIRLIYTEAYFKPQYENQPLFHQIVEFLYHHGFYMEDIYNPYYNNHQILWCEAIFVKQNS